MRTAARVEDEPIERSNSPEIISMPTPSAEIPMKGIALSMMLLLARVRNRKSSGTIRLTITQASSIVTSSAEMLPAGWRRTSRTTPTMPSSALGPGTATAVIVLALRWRAPA